jgi:hypothetical protein
MRIFLSTWTEQSQGETLNEVGVENRLLSFFFLQDVNDEWLESYFENGIGKGIVNKKIKDRGNNDNSK